MNDMTQILRNQACAETGLEGQNPQVRGRLAFTTGSSEVQCGAGKATVWDSVEGHRQVQRTEGGIALGVCQPRRWNSQGRVPNPGSPLPLRLTEAL